MMKHRYRSYTIKVEDNMSKKNNLSRKSEKKMEVFDCNISSIFEYGYLMKPNNIKEQEPLVAEMECTQM